MKAFQFRLEHALAWRRTRLAAEEARLERLRAGLRAVLEARLAALRTRVEEQARAGLAESVSGAELAAVDAVRRWSLAEAVRLASRAAEMQRDIAALERALLEARRGVRLLERLRERRLRTWRQDAERELEELAGESAIAQWRRSG